MSVMKKRKAGLNLESLQQEGLSKEVMVTQDTRLRRGHESRAPVAAKQWWPRTGLLTPWPHRSFSGKMEELC